MLHFHIPYPLRTPLGRVLSLPDSQVHLQLLLSIAPWFPLGQAVALPDASSINIQCVFTLSLSWKASSHHSERLHLFIFFLTLMLEPAWLELFRTALSNTVSH